MDSLDVELEKEIKELFNNLITKGKIEINKLNSRQYSKGIIIFIHKFIEKYINLVCNKRNLIWRNINFLNKKFGDISSKNFGYKNTNNKHIKNIFLLIYLMIFRYQISMPRTLSFNLSKKFLLVKNLYNFLKIMTSFTSKFYLGKIIDISELGIILKMLIIFCINNTITDIKENSDIVNIMYFKECINIILIIFNVKPDKNEQQFLIDIFNYINRNICFRDKNKTNLNYTNKYYLLHNDYKTTKLIKLMNFIYKINNNDLTKIYFEFLINIYYFQYSYNNFNWELYKLLHPLFENIQEKNYETILKEISFPEFQFNFIKELMSRERDFIRNNDFIFKSAFYFSGKQPNSGIIGDIGNIKEIKEHFLLSFGFNLIITDIPKPEYIIFQIKNYEQILQLKVFITRINEEYFMCINDSRLNKDGLRWKIKINPNHYYSFVLVIKKGKNIHISYFIENKFFEEPKAVKIKEIKTSNLLLGVGCEFQKININSNSIHDNYIIKNMFTGFIGDIFLINMHSYKDKFSLQKNILYLKGKYGYTLVKSVWEQKSLDEYITSNLEKTTKNLGDLDDKENLFKKKISDKRNFKILENTELYITSSNFRLVEYMDNIDYKNYDNYYHQKEKLVAKSKKENQFLNNLRTKDSVHNKKVIELGSSLFNCNFNFVENTSSLIKFIEEDGIFYMILIMEYYYQILFKISKDVLSDNKSDSITLSKEQNEIINIIERGIEDYLDFFYKKMKDNYFNIKQYKKILFFYQVNVVIKQFILLKNISNNIFELLIEFLKRYQHFLKEYINASYNEDNAFYKNQRNFFFDFLLNPALYQQNAKNISLKKLDTFLDITFEIIKDNIFDEDFLSENIFQKIFNFTFLFNKENGEPQTKKSDKIISPLQKTKAKYLYILVNYLESFFSETSKKSDLINLYCDKLFNYKEEPIIFYNLSLILFVSKLIPELTDNFLKKMTTLFEENYIQTDLKNIIFSISSMLILSSYYLIYYIKDEEKLKRFKIWYTQLSQKQATMYFDKLYNLIIGGVFEINDLLSISKNISINTESNSNSQKLFDKKEREMNSTISLIKVIQKNIYGVISDLSGYQILKKKFSNTEENNEIKENKQENNIEEAKKFQRKETITKPNTKKNINIKINKEANEIEIEKIKNGMNNERFYNTYFCSLDDIKKRCFIYNPKNVLVKRLFSHIFYKSLFHCKAFMLIKNRYLNTFPEANIENKQLNYPSKMKNFSNIFEPKLFLKKDCHIYDKIYFTISHDYLYKIPPYYEEDDKIKTEKTKALLKANVSEIKFYEHRFNIEDILQEKDRYFDCELVNQQNTYFGFIILGDNYLYFGTKYEDPINLKDRKVEEIDIDYISKYSFSYRDKDNKTSKKKTFILFYQDIQRIIKRRSFLMYQSFEVYCHNGKSYYFNLYRKDYCENAFKILNAIRDNLTDKDKFEFVNENTTEEIKKINYEVRKGIITNFVYLLKLNYLSSRTYNDLNQYPVFPWLFFDIRKIDLFLKEQKNNMENVETTTEMSLSISSEQDIENFELEKPENISTKISNEDLTKKFQLRNFIYPVSMQTEDKRENYAKNGFIPYGTHYSTASYIYYYLIRTYPFSESMIQLQNLNKENPNRLFTSLEESLAILYENVENREACPQFFTNFDYYCNLNCDLYGIQHNDFLVDDFRVGKENDISGNLYSIYFKYVYLFRSLLNSYLVSKFLPNWIDFIFGVKQTEKNKESFYIFNKVSYEDKLKLDKKLEKYIKRYQNNEGLTNKELRNKINLKIDFLNNFGITPRKVLNGTIKLRTSAKIKKLPDGYLEINKNIYFAKVNDNNLLILFKNPNNQDKTKNILLWNYSSTNINNIISDKKNLYNCGYLKQLTKTTIEGYSTKIPIFKPCYSMCNFIMFNKLFIVTCRYLGNIFKVQTSDYCIDVFCEDFVSCIACRKALDSVIIDDEVIYTGLKNGKLIEWYIKQNLNDYNKINIKERNNYHCHKGEITCIEIYHNQHVLITGGEDKMIFIRKTYDFELLTAINLTYCYMNPIVNQKTNIIPTLIKVSDLNCIYVLIHDFDNGLSFIRGYNLNGLFIKQSEEKNFMNICFTKNYNLLVTYYNRNEIQILNCYNLEVADFFIFLPSFVENIENNFNKKKNKNEKGKKDILVWNEYYHKNHELILLYEDKIVRGNIKDKDDQKDLEYY